MAVGPVGHILRYRLLRLPDQTDHEVGVIVIVKHQETLFEVNRVKIL